MKKEYSFTETQLAEAFAKWLMDQRVDPEGYNKVDDYTPEEYGESSAKTLLELLGQVS